MISDTHLLKLIECLLSVVYYSSRLVFTDALGMIAQKHQLYVIDGTFYF